MRNKKKKIIEHLKIETVTDQGYGLGRHDGKVIFAEKTIPGDVVNVCITKNKSDYAISFPTVFHEKSKLRVQPFCHHFATCGGCTWQNVSYETQLQFKKQLVEDAFRRIGKFVDLPKINDVFPSPFEKYYRNKLEFTFSNKRWFDENELNVQSSKFRKL